MDMFLEFGIEDGDVEDLCIIESVEIAADRALLALNTHDALADINHREIELRCFSESADFETSQEYFEDAAKEIEEKREGLLKKLWKTIKELFEKIRDALFGKKKPKVTPETKNKVINVKKGLANIIKNIKKVWAGAKSALANGKKKLSENHNWIKLLALIGIVGVGAAAGTTAYKHHKSKNTIEKVSGEVVTSTPRDKNNDVVEMKYGEIVDAYYTMEDIADTCTSVATKGYQNPSAVEDENAPQLKTLASAIKLPMRQCVALIEDHGANDGSVIHMDGPVKGYHKAKKNPADNHPDAKYTQSLEANQKKIKGWSPDHVLKSMKRHWKKKVEEKEMSVEEMNNHLSAISGMTKTSLIAYCKSHDMIIESAEDDDLLGDLFDF